MGNEAGKAGIPCKDFSNGCRCDQCESARNVHRNVFGNAGIPCKDFSNGCRCEMCQNARRTHNGAKALFESPDVKYTVDLPEDPLHLHRVKDATKGMTRFRKESIGGELEWDGGATSDFRNACGSEAVSWCLQVAGKDPNSISYRSGPNTCENLYAMLEEAELSYESKPGFYCEEIDPHLKSERPALVLISTKYHDNFNGEDFESSGKYHWIVICGIDSENPMWYWLVSNGSICGRVNHFVVKYLVNHAMFKLTEGGHYAGEKVILVDW